MSHDIVSGLILAAVFTGFFVAGWICRSLLFGYEKDCANPEHDDKPQSWE